MSLEQLRHDDMGPAEAPLAYCAVKNVRATKRDRAGASTYFITTPKNEVLEFGEEEYVLWQLLDGNNSFRDIQAKFAERCGVQVAREQFNEFLAQLLGCEIVERLTRPGTETPALPPPAAPATVERELPERPSEAEPRPIERTRRRLDPAPVLNALAWLGGPLRRFRWLLLPAVTASVLALAPQLSTMLREFAGLEQNTGLVLLTIGIVVTGVVPRLTQACVAAFYGLPSRSWRLALEPRVPPLRLRFDETPYEALAARGVTSALTAPLLARLALMSGGTVYWLLAHGGGNLVATQAIVIGQLALLSFLISSSPLFRTDGRRWLTTVLAEPDSFAAEKRNRRHLVIAGWLWGLGVVAVALLYGAPYLPLPLGTVALRPETLTIAGTGLAAGVLLATRLWLRSVTRNPPRIAYRSIQGERGAQAALAKGGVVIPFDRDAVPAISPNYRPVVPFQRSLMPVIMVAAAFALLEGVAFVSYPYEAGGSFTILPFDSSQLNARVQGELTEVLVNEGDQVVSGQVLGILSDWQQTHNLAISKAQLQNAEANLQHLLETPRPEDVELARKQYDSVMARLPYDKAQFERYAALVGSDIVSRSNYDQVLSQYQQDQAAAEVARANYDQVRAGPTPAQIEAARAQVRQNAATVAFNEDELERTRVRATTAGKVVTPNPMLLRGKWFAQGTLVFTVEDHRSVQADVQVPETDIGNVTFGGAVRLRLWGYPDTTFIGKSVGLAPDAQTPANSTTNIIRVRTEVPNPADLLHPNMTGYAKMTGAYMPTWNAYTQMFERFFLVQFWYWIP